MSDSNENVSKKAVSRRNVIKWAGALAAVGVVGVGLGFGGDLLIRPNTTKTTTAAVTAPGSTQTTTVTGQGSTTTLTVPPPTLSYLPPLSPSVQTTVNGIFQNLEANHTGETVTYSGCGALGCMTHCYIKVLTKNGVITSVVPDDTINTGVAREDQLGLGIVKTGMIQFRGCPMGYGWKQMVYDPNRLLYPMKQVGTKGAGSKFTRITWTEALDTIAAQLSNCNSKYGPYSIVSSHSGTNNGNTLLSALGYGVTTWGAYSGSAYDCGEPLIEGSTRSSGGAASSIADIFNSKLVILLGRLPTTVDGQGGGFGYASILAKEAGVKFISIDCRYTVDAQALNAQWIPIRQGTDIALILAIADVMFQQNLVNQSFVTQYVEPNGFATWKNYVTGVSDGVEKSPQWAATITGVPAATIQALAQLYASSKPSKLLLGWEMARPSNVNITRACILLQAMAGYTLTPGGGGPLELGYGKNSW
ncbi:MAG: molybdopterin-dependent oxidoreductase, partial [Nitrososphaerales archaeon]